MMRKIIALSIVMAMSGIIACDRRGGSDTKSEGAAIDTPVLWLGGAGPGGGGGGGAPPPNTTVLPNALIPAGTAPIVGVTFELAFAQDVSLTDFAFMQGIWSQANQLLWQVTEGQTYIAQVNMSDNVQPFSYASELGNTYNPTNLDVVVYTTGFWDMFGASAFVTYDPTYGRDGRLMALQTTNNANTILHEAFHFLYVLSWRYYQLTNIHACLDDEYNFSPDDAECVMEINFTPTIRLCSGGTLPNGNHLVDAVNSTTGTAQAWQISGPPPVGAPFVYEDGQPRSCWEQLIADYPGMVYGGQNSTTQTTPATQFSINNTGTQ